MTHVRIAVLADIHGNAAALRAVLSDLDAQSPDRVVVAGDVINGGPDSPTCWKIVRDRGFDVLRGNHERYVLSARAGIEPFDEEMWRPARWTRGRFDDADLDAIAVLPETLEVDGVLFCHASPRNDIDRIVPSTPAEEVRPMISGVGHDVVVRGHNHVAFELRVDGIRLIAVGAVGLPFGDPPMPAYAIVARRGGRWIVEHRRVPYDPCETVRACVASGYLEEGGPVARLFTAEIATGRQHLTPFIRARAGGSFPGDLADAVDAYLDGRFGRSAVEDARGRTASSSAGAR